MENERLYIPYGLTAEKEYFTGFGINEVRQCGIGITAFAAAAAVIYMITSNIAAVVSIVITGIAGCVMMTRKDRNTRLSPVTQVINMIRFGKGQRVYKYIYKSTWN